MWPRSRRLDLEGVSTPIKVSVSSWTDWQTCQSRSWNCLGIGLEQLGLVHKSFFRTYAVFFFTKYHNVASALSTFRTIEFFTVPQAFTL